MTDGSDLPPELIAHIIDSLCDAQSALRRCSLVCRAWVSRSQRLLFRKFKITAYRANLKALRDLLVGAPHLGAYIREISFLGPSLSWQDVAAVHNFASGTSTADREDIQSLFSLLPNITVVRARHLASSPFLFTNSALRQCHQLRQFLILDGSLHSRDVVPPTSIFPSFEGTTVKDLCIERVVMPAAMDTPLLLHLPMCAIERLSLDVRAHDFSVWLPYFESVLPQWKNLKVMVDPFQDKFALHEWSDSLRTGNLSGLNRFHLDIHIHSYDVPFEDHPVVHFPSKSLFLSAPSNHLLLTARLFSYGVAAVLQPQIILRMVEWYLCTLTALARGGDCTLKKLTFTAEALGQAPIATAWAKIDDTLSLLAFNRLEKVYFLDTAGCLIKTQSKPRQARRLQELLPLLSRSGKLAV